MMYGYVAVHRPEISWKIKWIRSSPYISEDRMFIKYQKIVRNDAGIILSGSASLVAVSYVRNRSGNHKKSHSKETVVEKLGKVIWINPNDRNQAIFLSPARGLVFYDASTDVFTPVEAGDSRLLGTKAADQPPRLHTNFGLFYLFFSEMEKSPFMNVLRSAFPDQKLYKKLLAHLAHGCLKNGSSIKCGEFLSGSCLSYILEGIPVSMLNSDTPYFSALSDDHLKVSYFRSLITEMRKEHPEFGRCCYVDSTPLPGEAENNPYNALSGHGTDGMVTQSRLVLILDIQTSIPVWFEIIPSNVLDKSTILSITNDLYATLDIKIDMYDLDAGYARAELFELFNRNNSTYIDENDITRDHTVLVRMPATNGYPRDELYINSKPFFNDPDYEFDYESHTFFGKRYEVDLFGYPEYAFVLVDQTQAQDLLRGWRTRHMEEWEALSKSAKEWYRVKDGFFVLIGNKDQSPRNALIEYRGRTDIEGFFKDGKTYLQILPMAKWTKETVTGKILHDIIETSFYREFRKRMAPLELSMSNLLVSMNGWECVKISDDLIEVKTPNLQVREIMEKLGYVIPAHLKLEDLRKEVLEGIPMPRPAYAAKGHRTKAKETVPISPEEKREAREKEKQEREQRKAEEKARKAAEREKAKEQRQKEREKSRKENSAGNHSLNGRPSAEEGTGRKKPGVPKGTRRGMYNKDGSLRKKPGPKPKVPAIA